MGRPWSTLRRTFRAVPLLVATGVVLMVVSGSGHAAGDQPPECGADDLAVSLQWEADGNRLRGEVVAENIGQQVCRLGNKPTVKPLGFDGKPLPTDFVVTLETRVPPYVVVHPGQRAHARVSWTSWCGAPASSRALVEWQGGSAVVDVSGPRQPGCSDDPQNLSSGWFELE